MDKLKIELPFATLLPDFIYQFLSAEQVDKAIFTCLELEDVRDALVDASEPELKEIKDFLNIIEESTQAETEGGEETEQEGEEGIIISKESGLENMMEEVDAELEEIDDENYHRYTPGELKYIFEKIIYNINLVYDYCLKLTGVPLTLSIGFRFVDDDEFRETNLVVDFLHTREKPEPAEGAFFVPMKNYLVSDDVMARAYFFYEPEYKRFYAKKFDEIVKLITLKGIAGESGEGPRPDLH
ncbi:MAG TPA: hypothetical protein PLB12_06015 [Candidatus Goldiibacteriota bacterium]|nr:hypothetical protein [Candidatus Goldiibacteriota bacterium]